VTAGFILWLLAFVCFLLAAFHAPLPPAVDLVALGLAFLTAGLGWAHWPHTP
jgi:hypothetical protein